MDRILFIPKTDFDYYENVELVINEPENEIALEGLRCQVRGVLCDIDDGEDVERYTLTDIEELKGGEVDGIYFTAEKWWCETPCTSFRYYIVRDRELIYEGVMEDWV